MKAHPKVSMSVAPRPQLSALQRRLLRDRDWSIMLSIANGCARPTPGLSAVREAAEKLRKAGRL